MVSLSDQNGTPRHDGVGLRLAAEPLLEHLDTLLADARKAAELLGKTSPAATAYRRCYEGLRAAMDRADQVEVWLTTKRAADEMGCSLSNVQRLCALSDDERPFVARKVSGNWRILASSLPTQRRAA